MSAKSAYAAGLLNRNGRGAALKAPGRPRGERTDKSLHAEWQRLWGTFSVPLDVWQANRAEFDSWRSRPARAMVWLEAQRAIARKASRDD